MVGKGRVKKYGREVESGSRAGMISTASTASCQLGRDRHLKRAVAWLGSHVTAVNACIHSNTG